MEKASSVIAAFDAGKMPSQKQISQFIDSVLKSGLVEVEPSEGSGELSKQGKVLAQDLRDVLEAYKKLGEDKNGDDQLQEAFWHLSEGDLSNTSINTGMDVDEDEASRDARAIRAAVRNFLSIAWTNLSSEGSNLFDDFASFARLTLADAAEAVEVAASKTKEGLRSLDEDIQEGERDNLGRKKRKIEDEQPQDPKAKFEKGMDTAKEYGSSAIGAGQEAKARAENVSKKTSDRLTNSYYQMVERAQKDPQYRESVTTVFDVCQKWLDKTLDTASDVNKDTSLESFINDPTPEQHTIQSLRAMRTLAERLAGGKSLDDLFAHLRTCLVDIRQDEDLKKWFNDFLAHVRRSLDEPGYIHSDECSERYSELRQRWRDLMNADSEEGRKWKADVKKFNEEWTEFNKRIDRDQDVQRIRSAWSKFGSDLEDAMLEAGSTGLQLAAGQATWFWQDVFNVYLPRVFAFVKDIPIPRTEYKDAETEFVLEDLDISSFSLLPGHVFIRNITDVDISAPQEADTKTAVGAFTHIHVQGMQLALREVSFYYHDKTASVGPGEFTGLMELTLPPQGIDIDLRVRMLPNTPAGLKEREKVGGFQKVESVDVKVTDGLAFDVKQSNHPILVTMFKPVMTSVVKNVLETTLREQIRGAIEQVDHMAWDIGNRAEVFQDTGLPRGASLIAGFWSELGKMARQPGGLTEGWKATGTGVVRRDPTAPKGAEAPVFAMGAEPQILSGEKRGPKGTNSEPLKDRLDIDVDASMESAQEGLKGVAQKAGEGVKQGVQKVRSFKESVKQKVEEEKSRPGWQSPAFDV
ncbi:hypothetical protein GLOTRDRAFT_64155 [Gloeophyllum trabeum ATCC 11539]|uniref:Uncharacterized protein n=1 Tax=Gloeophyllum trabeum (strain ATCC 11539 / FP-39264 / Madison 617) TaxID=670483 RepID=S7PYU9_GLOTA|nr:uncharacterized protein GLOTRDRAFT_64155 [Gloeophyllum trabeum ATCC 11539]EPQ52477.1 hypothetical protein GLOTRDRAFT_64155 [Gloeophyllum trabeum ATCC 11539]